MRKRSLEIRLNGGWTFFSVGRTDMQMIGTVQDGMQIGALGQKPDGSYLQVNGDMLRPLNTSKVEHALDKVTRNSRGAKAVFTMPAAEPKAPVVVVVKKKRRLVATAVD